ncbi:hypothetical protein K7X08_037310 [Anisodus acutangulus]|uniref:Uncharacterized protein n=1 Tax=Anisodus acutangulus TaxID=402998 RepID=A0A9Q1N0N0_9SOLA|nr:hypothetical protein K7X08_037310 [Anisodus acutangulus]
MKLGTDILSDNNLTGSLPHSLFHSRSLSLLDLSRNRFSGELPENMGKLRGLKMLNISYNGLKGKIPATLGNLESLESIDLSHNTFSGPIPQSFTKLQQLTTLDVSNNHLKDKIPIGGQMDTMDDPTYYANNSGLCGFQIQLNCPDNKPPQVVEPVNESNESWEQSQTKHPFRARNITGVVEKPARSSYTSAFEFS